MQVRPAGAASVSMSRCQAPIDGIRTEFGIAVVTRSLVTEFMCTTNRPVASRTSLGPLKTLTFWIGSLDLDADARGVGEDVELLDPDDGAAHSAIVEAQPGDDQSSAQGTIVWSIRIHAPHSVARGK